jgi:uncharacterized protein YegL
MGESYISGDNMQETRGNVLPVYFVGDESFSMDGEPINQLNVALSKLRDEAARSPAIGEVARFGVITFAGDALCRLELGPLTHEMAMPTLACRDGGTSYRSVFLELRQRLPGDVATLKAGGYKVHRPVVFFLSDGQPTDSAEFDWREPLADLQATTFHERPNILAFGFGQAEEDTIKAVASQPRYAWIQADGTSAANAVAEFGASLIVSISRSADKLKMGLDEVEAPEPKGFVSLDSPVL